jgi:hypothetical protein
MIGLHLYDGLFKARAPACSLLSLPSFLLPASAQTAAQAPAATQAYISGSGQTAARAPAATQASISG